MSDRAESVLPDPIERAVCLYESGERDAAESAFAKLLNEDGKVGSLARECSTQLSLAPNERVDLRQLIVSSGLLDAELEWSGLLDAVSDVSSLGESGFDGARKRQSTTPEKAPPKPRKAPRVLDLPRFGDKKEDLQISSPGAFFGSEGDHGQDADVVTLEFDDVDGALLGDEEEEEDIFGTGRLTERPASKVKPMPEPSSEMLSGDEDTVAPWLDVEPVAPETGPDEDRAARDELEELRLIFSEAKELVDSTPIPNEVASGRPMPFRSEEPSGKRRAPVPDDFGFIDPAELSFGPTMQGGDHTPPPMPTSTRPVQAADPLLICRQLLRSGQLVQACVAAEEYLTTPSPSDTATRFLEDVRGELRTQAVELLKPLDRVPRLKISLGEIRNLKHIDHRGGYLLSLVDGATNLEMLIELGTMPRDEAAALLLLLLERDVIEC